MTGAIGGDTYDQLAYLAWIRDEGSHLLASNLWSIAPTPHDYLHPMFFVSGLLWRLGASVQVAYLLWKPVALLVLFIGFAAYVRRALPDRRGAQAAALLVALFYETPLVAVAHWTSFLSSPHQIQLLLAADDPNSALNLWGFDHTAIAIGLMPVFLIACERLLRAPSRRWTALAALAGALVAWLRPWQGLTLLVIVGLLFVARPPRRRFLALAVPLAATVLPLAYGVVLARADPSWASFQHKSIVEVGTAPWWALLASFGPLAALAALAVPRPRADGDWMLLAWPVACGAVYFLIPEFPPHALSGVTLPLAVLAARGWQRLKLPLRFGVVLAIAAVAAITVPAAIFHAKTARDEFTDPTHAPFLKLQVLGPDDAAALRFIARSPVKGGVFAPQFLAMAVPGLTGHPTYVGHVMWQPLARTVQAGRFYSPALRDPGGTIRRAILRSSRARFVVTECGAPPALASAIAGLVEAVTRFGCVSVYETRPGVAGSPAR